MPVMTPQKLREIDALVAEKVMGWTPNYPGGWLHPPKDEPNRQRHFDHAGATVIPAYSSDIAAAWEVLDMMERKGFDVLIARTSNHGGWECELNLGDGRFLGDADTVFMSRADTAPLAICLASLKLKGIEVP